MFAHGVKFLDALKYAGKLAGVEMPAKMTAEERQILAEREAQLQRIASAAGKLDAAEHSLRLGYCAAIHRCEVKQDTVRQRLGELHGGAPERWRCEYEGCWAWLATLTPLLREHLAAYWLLSFSSARERALFVVNPGRREEMIQRVLGAGGLVANDGKWVEVLG